MLKNKKLPNGGHVLYDRMSRGDIKFVIDNLLSQIEYNSVQNFDVCAESETVHNNRSFWRKVENRDFTVGQTVILKEFSLSEWVPISPGTYHTDYAEQARFEAGRYSSMFSNKPEYTLRGKANMIRGGLGCVRFAPKSFKSNDKIVSILSASSNARFHEGIPLLLEGDFVDKYISLAKDSQNYNLDILGKLTYIPTRSYVDRKYPVGMPKLCLKVSDIKSVKKIKTKKLVTVAATYHVDFSENHWTFASFNLDRKEQNIRLAAEWILNYASRYNNGLDFGMLHDFDQQIKWFDETLFDFSTVIRNKQIDFNNLKKLCEANGIDLNIQVVKGNNNILMYKSNQNQIIQYEKE